MGEEESGAMKLERMVERQGILALQAPEKS